MQTEQDNPEKAKAVLAFFAWAYKEGQAMTKELDYVPLEDKEIQLIQASWKQNIKDKAGNPIW